MARTTVKAMKDPRATSPARVPPGAWPAAMPALPPQEAETLVAVIRTLCPHGWLADATYRDAAFALVNDAVADPQATITLREGLRALAADGFASRPEAQRVAKLANRAETPFFRMSLAGAVRYLYDLPEVWAGCGYDGASGCSDYTPRDDFNTARPAS